MRPETCRLLRFAALVAALSVPAFAGCKIEHDPAKKVTVEVTGPTTETDRKRILDAVKHWTDGSSHLMTSMHSGDKLSIDLSPVTDVDAFAKKIDFGEVTKVDGRKISVTFKKP